MNLKTWLNTSSWYIRLFQRDRWKVLTAPFDPDDFTEVGPPGEEEEA